MTIILTLLFLVTLLVYIAISNALLYISLKLVTNKRIEEKKLILPSLLNFILLIVFIVCSYFILSSISIKGISTTFMNLLFKATSFKEILNNAILPIIAVIGILFIFSTFTLLTVNVNYSRMKWNIKQFFKKIFKKKNKDLLALNPESNSNNEIINIADQENDIISEDKTTNISELKDKITNNTTKLENNNLDKTILVKTVNYTTCEKTTDEIIKEEQEKNKLNQLITLEDKNKITYLNSLIANIFIISLIIFTFTIFFSAGYLLSDTIMKFLS